MLSISSTGCFKRFLIRYECTYFNDEALLKWSETKTILKLVTIFPLKLGHDFSFDIGSKMKWKLSIFYCLTCPSTVLYFLQTMKTKGCQYHLAELAFGYFPNIYTKECSNWVQVQSSMWLNHFDKHLPKMKDFNYFSLVLAYMVNETTEK